MSQEDFEVRFGAVVRRVLGLEGSAPIDGLTQESFPAWTSIRQVELLIALQKTFRVFFRGEELPKLRSVAALREHVRQKQREAGGA